MAAASRRPTFAAEFDKPLSLNTGSGGTWKTKFHGGERTLAGNAEEQIYVDPAFKGTASAPLGLNPFSVSNGVLKISARPASAAAKPYLRGFDYTSGLLTTEKSFQQQYGYFEIRAKDPAGKGMFPAFWMLAPGKWPPEIDVYEQIGSSPGYVSQGMGSATGTFRNKGIYTGIDMTKAFHTYGMEWTKQNITWAIDGKQTFKVATPADMHQPMYLLLNLAVGGNWAGSPDATTNWSRPTYWSTTCAPTAWGSAPATPPPAATPTPGSSPGKITITQGMRPTDRVGAVDVALGRANTGRVYDVPPAPGGHAGGKVTAVFDAQRDLALVNQSAWNKVKNALISHAPGDVTVRNFVDVELAARGRNDRIDIAGVKRGTIATGDGNDNVTIAGRSNGTSLNLTRVLAGNGDDRVSFSGGDSSKARLDGGAGNDRLTLAGKAGGTTVGGVGNDLLADRATGAVTLSGGGGADTFAFTRGGKARVTDFAAGLDRIQLSGIGAGQVRAAISGADTLLSLGGESSVRLAGVHLTQPQLAIRYV